MPTKMPNGASRQDAGSYTPENLGHLKMGGNISRDLPREDMSAQEILADESLVKRLKIRSMAISLAKYGQILPIAIREDCGRDGVVVDGARRLLGFLMVNADPLQFKDRDGEALKGPLPIKFSKVEADDEKALELNLIANLERLELDVIDRAHTAQKVKQLYKWNNDRIASCMSCDESTVSVLLGIARLPKGTKDLIRDGVLTGAGARRLIGLPEKEVRAITKEIEGGATAKEVLARVTAKKRSSGEMIARTRSEVAAEIAKLNTSRSRWFMQYLAGGDGDLGAIFSDDAFECGDPADEEIPSTVLIGGKAVEVHEAAS